MQLARLQVFRHEFDGAFIGFSTTYPTRYRYYYYDMYCIKRASMHQMLSQCVQLFKCAINRNIYYTVQVQIIAFKNT